MPHTMMSVDGLGKSHVATAFLPPRSKLPQTEEWIETMSLDEARSIVPKAVLDILTEDGYDTKRYRNIRVLKKPRQGHWCLAVDVHHNTGFVKTLHGLVAEWPFIRSYGIVWHRTAQCWQYGKGKKRALHSELANRRYGPTSPGTKVLHQGADLDGTNRHDVTLLCYGTHSENMTSSNRNKSPYASSKYHFVSFHKIHGMWTTKIPFDNKYVCKYFKTEGDAWSFVQTFCAANNIPLGSVRSDIAIRDSTYEHGDLFGIENDVSWVLTLQEGQPDPRRMILGNAHVNSQIKPVVDACHNFVRRHGRPMSMDRHGRVRLKLQGRLEALHRHMFRFASGKNIHPNHQIDHFDHNKYDISPDNLGITTPQVNSSKQLGDGVYTSGKNGIRTAVAAFGKTLYKSFPSSELALEFVAEKKRAICEAIVSCLEAALLPDDHALELLVEQRAAKLKAQWDAWYTNKC